MAVGGADSYANYEVRELKGKEERSRDPSRQHETIVTCMAWSCDGKYLAYGNNDGAIRVWIIDPFHGNSQGSTKMVTQMKSCSEKLIKIAWSPTSAESFASISGTTLRLWDRLKSECTQETRSGGKDDLDSLSYHTSGKEIVIANTANEIMIVDILTNRIVRKIESGQQIHDVSVSLDGKYLYVAAKRGLEMMSYDNLTPLMLAKGHGSTTSTIAIDPQKKYIATGSSDATVAIWDVTEHAFPEEGLTHIKVPYLVVKKVLYDFNSCPRVLAFSPDGAHLAFGFQEKLVGDEKICIHSADTGESVYEIQAPNPVYSLAWNPKNNVLAFTGGHRPDPNMYPAPPRGYNQPRPPPRIDGCNVFIFAPVKKTAVPDTRGI